MPMSIRGEKQVASALRSLSRGVPATMLNNAAKVAVKPMQQDIKENARRLRDYVGKYPDFFPQPRRRPKGGHLDQSILFRLQKVWGRGKRRFRLGPSRRAKKLAHLVEFGTAPHRQPKFKGGWMHPGARAKPFMTPAYDKHKVNVSQRMAKEIWRLILIKITTLRGR